MDASWCGEIGGDLGGLGKMQNDAVNRPAIRTDLESNGSNQRCNLLVQEIMDIRTEERMLPTPNGSLHTTETGEAMRLLRSEMPVQHATPLNPYMAAHSDVSWNTAVIVPFIIFEQPSR